MQSKKKPTAGMQSRPGDDAVVEIDPALARNVGIADGAKVSSPPVCVGGRGVLRYGIGFGAASH